MARPTVSLIILPNEDSARNWCAAINKVRGAPAHVRIGEGIHVPTEHLVDEGFQPVKAFRGDVWGIVVTDELRALFPIPTTVQLAPGLTVHIDLAQVAVDDDRFLPRTEDLHPHLAMAQILAVPRLKWWMRLWLWVCRYLLRRG